MSPPVEHNLEAGSAHSYKSSAGEGTSTNQGEDDTTIATNGPGADGVKSSFNITNNYIACVTSRSGNNILNSY